MHMHPVTDALKLWPSLNCGSSAKPPETHPETHPEQIVAAALINQVQSVPIQDTTTWCTNAEDLDRDS